MPEIIYGVRPVIEALGGGRRKVFEVLDASGNGEVAQAATAAGVPVKKVPHARVGELARGSDCSAEALEISGAIPAT